ncbi:probable E3 ubiquitin-protein ligase MID2 isoform X2 [Fundulus heteroclitus]|uniref:probable E3 ubiquitin-protein ligase MID2 isoform X2 n=1 Tax=Fundulus heteroclitus TaxID=8078 RepID=UPI00165AFF21|nr:probable E3 ubiquitin-protein ligase MID2 isoform X2 [Fundulus heteroclitus]
MLCYYEDIDGESTQSSRKCSNADSSLVLPVDGAVDLREEELEQSVYGLCFALDPSAVPPSLRLSNSCLTVTYSDSTPSRPHPPIKVRKPAVTPDSMALLPHVCADVIIARGQYYWEVDVCNSSVCRVGVISSDGCSSWWLERNASAFRAVYDGSCEPIGAVPPGIKTLGIFLSFEGGILSFHNPLTQEHLVTLPTRFNPSGVLPALGLRQGRLSLRCGLPVPSYVFLGKDSTYRGPSRPNGVWRHREVPFQPVRRVIQKFEKLALSV